MSQASERLAQLLDLQATLTADITRVSERIARHETQIASFRDSVKTIAEPLYDQVEFEKAQQDMEKILQDHQSPKMGSSMALALSLLKTLAIAVPEVVQDREKLRQGRHANANKFMEAILKSLDEDRARLVKFHAKLKEVNALIK